jgi:TonB family protein
MVLVRPQRAQSSPQASGRAAFVLGLCTFCAVAAGQSPAGPGAGEAGDAPPGTVDPSDGWGDDPSPAALLPTEAHLTRLETQIQFVDRVRTQQFDEALPLAEAMVELTEEEFGSPSAELAVALNNQAIIERNLELYDESNTTFLASIDMFREVEGPFTESIIAPLVALGANYHAIGNYPQALGLFQEARTVNRRSFGLLNPDQIDIVYHISATLSSMQRYEEAHAQEEEALRLMERVYGTDTMELLPYLYHYADWLVNAFQFEPGRVQYVRAMDIIRAQEGPDSPTLIKPLREIGNSYRVQKLAEGRGISALKRALEIAELQPDTDKLEVARVLRDIGDWYTAFSRVGATGDEYHRAWELLGDVEDGESIRKDWFAEPDYVLREYPSTRGLAQAGDPGVSEGFVRVVFDVDEEGKPLNVNVLESDPPGFKDETMTRAIRRSRFRPRVVDGVTTYSTGLIRNFTFRYNDEE